ncbi:MAG TPA: BadF/BadG/BcrA/BcrD ATPase family protein [Streptosporangiaceae bacterium]|nr:BadF/BadG/BcrA/BcrD ATPase family protein [Streptosporangiaceae bacterium]
MNVTIEGDGELRALASTLPGRLLGVDVGGSGTRVVLLENGQVTVRPDGPPMNALLTVGFADQVQDIIGAADPTVVGIGLPGVHAAGLARELSQMLTRRAGCPVHVAGDADAARCGAFLGAPGIVVIAGTGSAALGWDGERLARAGGHGFLLGDEGSAYWIGREAVRSALCFQEHAGGTELIHAAVTQTTGSGLDVLISEVSAHPADRGHLTVLAPVVTGIAEHDPEAQRIVRCAADHLAALAESIRRRLGPLPVAGAGGVFRAPAIWARFAELTGATRPLAPAAVGAALLPAISTPCSPDVS